MRTTLIIPTLNRPDDLARCLQSISQLHRGFDEIIIIDQGDPETTKRVAGDYDHLNLEIYPQAVRSLTRARNLGMEKAIGELVFFVDDDTALGERYVQSAVDHFAEYPEVVGLTGYVDEGFPLGFRLLRLLKRLMAVLLFTDSFRMEVLRSGANTFPLGAPRFRYVEWLNGCHMVYRRGVFEAGFRFDERLIRWGFGEDVMFSYQVWKHYGPGSLVYLPAFRLRHYSSPEQSLTDEAVVRMHVIYRFIFWYKEVYDDSLLNALCYLYSQINFSISLLRRYRRSLRTIVESFRYLLRHHRDIARERIDYNRFITEGRRSVRSRSTSAKSSA